MLRFDPATSPRAARTAASSEAKARYAALLRRFAAGDTDNLTPHERRILHAFGDKADAARLSRRHRPHPLSAGPGRSLSRGADPRRRPGRRTSPAFSPHHGVPAEIARASACRVLVQPGRLFQGRRRRAVAIHAVHRTRFMRVDGMVDERLDPYSATEAAANLMLYNYRLLGTWPLAVTAYNHGPGGLRRAQDELGTSNIAVIVKRYQGATFGFASSNFYVAFLAALEVDRNAEKYFGPDRRGCRTRESTLVHAAGLRCGRCARPRLQSRYGRAARPESGAPAADLEQDAGWCRAATRCACRGAVRRRYCGGLGARCRRRQRFRAQRNDGAHRARRGETLASIAAASGVTLHRLLAANGLLTVHALARGEMRAHPHAAAARAEGSAPAIAAAAAAAPPPAEALPAAAATARTARQRPRMCSRASRRPGAGVAAADHEYGVCCRPLRLPETATPRITASARTTPWSCRLRRPSGISPIGPQVSSASLRSSTSCIRTPW